MKRAVWCLFLVSCLLPHSETARAEREWLEDTPIVLSTSTPLTSEQAVRDWIQTDLSRHFGLNEHSALEPDFTSGSIGDTSVVKVAHTHQGIVVIGSESRLAIDPQKNSINVLGHVHAIDYRGPDKAPMKHTDALKKAGLKPMQLYSSKTVLWSATDQNHVLAFEVDGIFRSGGGLGKALRLYLDAESGQLLQALTLMQRAKNRQVNNWSAACEDLSNRRRQFGIEDVINVADSRFSRKEGQAPVSTMAINRSYDLLGKGYDFMSSVLGLDSLDDNGIKLNMYANVLIDDEGDLNCEGEGFNAFWAGKLQSLFVTAEGLDFEEVVMHELAHGIVSNGSNLEYAGQAGALNESIADVIGVSFRGWLAAGGEGSDPVSMPRDMWKLRGPGFVLRDVADPRMANRGRERYPDHMDDFLNWPVHESHDYGGVHYNSSILNMAFYLLSQGGSHPHKPGSLAVDGIGVRKAAKIVAQAASKLLFVRSNFKDARFAYAQAAASLFGQGSPEWVAVHMAMDAVGVRGAWEPPAQPEPDPQPEEQPETPPQKQAPETEPDAEQPTTEAAGDSAEINPVIFVLIAGVGLLIAAFALMKARPKYADDEDERSYGADKTSQHESSPYVTTAPSPAQTEVQQQHYHTQQVQHTNYPSARSPASGGNVVLQNRGQNVPLDEAHMQSSDGLVIGRASDLVHVHLQDKCVSRRHLRLRNTSNGYTVEDLNSTSGTCIDGVKIKPFTRVKLQRGQVIQIADFTFIFSPS